MRAKGSCIQGRRRDRLTRLCPSNITRTASAIPVLATRKRERRMGLSLSQSDWIIGGAYLVQRQPEGIYKYLITVSVYLIMPIAPAIVFGIMSKSVTFAGAAASVLVGLLLSGTCMADTYMAYLGVEEGQHWFPWLHLPLTLNYTWRGAWGTVLITLVLFLVSAFTKRTDPDKLARTTITWSGRWEPFRGLVDWRLQLAVLLAVTALAYGWLW